MSAFRSWRWSAVAITFSVFASAAQAEMITPDSIPNPPSAVSSPNGLVYANNVVNTQYTGLGLHFYDVASTKLNGITAWVPVGVVAGTPAAVGAIDYAWAGGGNFVSPGTMSQTTVSSLSINLIGLTDTPNMWVNGLNGQHLNLVPVLQGTPGLDGGQVWTFTGPGITSFGVLASGFQSGPWGVSAVSFTPATAPEPSTLVLAGLGVLGLASRLSCRRGRRIA